MDPPSYLFSSFVKRGLDYLRADQLSTHVNLNLLPHIRKFYGDVRKADILFQKWRRTTGRYLSNSFAIDDYVLVIARDAALCHFKTDQLALHAFLFLLRECFATGEVAVIQFANPTEVCFEQRGRIVDVVAVKRHACFES